jgi:prohibitin 2
MSGFITILVLLIAFGLLVAYMRKMQQGGFTRTELRQLAARGWVGGILLVVLILFATSIVAVPVGERLVVYNLMTRSFRQPLEPGYGIVLPIINERVKYDVRTQVYTMSGIVQEGNVPRADAIKVLSEDGLEMNLDITVQYRLDSQRINELHAEIGPDYVEKIIRPTVREAIRIEFAKHEATEAFSTKREEIETNLQRAMSVALEKYYIQLQEVQIRNIELPPMVATAIEEKKKAQQEAERMQYVLEQAQKEKEKKLIDAEAEAAVIETINTQLDLSPAYLNWLAIDKLNEDIQLVVTDGDTLLNLDAIKAH